VARRKASRAALSAAAGNPHASGGAPAKRLRAAAFAAWLVQTYGRDALAAGDGVLDVAGGAGGVSFELHCKWRIPVTTVDPRPAHLSREQHAFLAAAGVDPGAPGALPRHEAMLFEARSWSRFRGASLILGMHPDQATEPIVDAAAAFGVPFAVVPCCVFPTLFAARRVGPYRRRVTTRCVVHACIAFGGVTNARLCCFSFRSCLYRRSDDFVEYLLAKAPGSRAAWLPFEGANRVVFMPPAVGGGGAADAAAAAQADERRWWDERSSA
jgi:hypothetical protein